MEESETKDKTSIRNTLEELAKLNQKYLQTATNEADVSFYTKLGVKKPIYLGEIIIFLLNDPLNAT
jgi:hypothetical protein